MPTTFNTTGGPLERRASGGALPAPPSIVGSTRGGCGPSCKKCRQNCAGASCSSCHTSASDASSAPSLTSELAALADRHTQSPPEEIYELFPDWKTELRDILHTQTAAQLRLALAALEVQAEHEPDLATAYAFASAALREALGVHISLGSGDGIPAASPALGPSAVPSAAAATLAGSEMLLDLGLEGSELVSQLMRGAPDSVPHIFPNFESDLQAALKRPVSELRAAAKRLEATLAELEVRRFTESGEGGGEANGAGAPPATLSREVEAMAFAVRAMFALISAKASGVEEPPRPIPPREADLRAHDSSADSTVSSVGAFCFQSFFAPPPEGAGDAFNPCCVGVDLSEVRRRAMLEGVALGAPRAASFAWGGPMLELANNGTLPETPPSPAHSVSGYSHSSRAESSTSFSTLSSAFSAATTTVDSAPPLAGSLASAKQTLGRALSSLGRGTSRVEKPRQIDLPTPSQDDSFGLWLQPVELQEQDAVVMMGVIVAEISPFGVVARSGKKLRVGDVLHVVNGKAVTTPLEAAAVLNEASHSHSDLKTVQLVVTRTHTRPARWGSAGWGIAGVSGVAVGDVLICAERGNRGFGLTLNHVNRVTDVDVGSPAYKAGIRPFDRITAVDGVEVGEQRTLSELVKGHTSVRISVERPPRSAYRVIANTENEPKSSAYVFGPSAHDLHELEDFHANASPPMGRCGSWGSFALEESPDDYDCSAPAAAD